MSSLQLSSVAALCWLVAIFLGATGTAAQEDQRFFGRWLPASTSAGGWLFIVEPGRMYNVNDRGEIVYEERFQVIRDLGDRVAIKSWPVKLMMEGGSTKPRLMTFHLNEKPPFQILEVSYCVSPPVNAYFFKSDQPDKIWARIMTWSKKDGHFSELLHRFWDDCVIEPTTLEGIASGMGFYRELEKE